MGAIYSILNKVTGKIYVGQSINPYKRISQHKTELKGNYHPNNHLQSSWNKYGEKSFEFNILEHCSNDKLDDNEIWWINYFDSSNREKGYNNTTGGSSTFSMTPSVRKIISEKQKGENNSFFGKTHSPETKKRYSELRKGEKNGMYGKNHSVETKQKMSKYRSIHQNTTGFYHVCKETNPRCKQGFTWLYCYDSNGKRKKIRDVNLDKLKEKVESKGLIWKKIDKEGC